MLVLDSQKLVGFESIWWLRQWCLVVRIVFQRINWETSFPWNSQSCKNKSLVFDTPQVFDFLKVDSDAALLPS